MSEQIKQISRRIKELREISEISPESLSKELNISIETYLEYESGNIDIPVSFLYGIANKFNVELAAILTGDAPRLHTYSVVRKDSGVSVDRRKEYKYQSLAYNFVHKKQNLLWLLLNLTLIRRYTIIHIQVRNLIRNNFV